MRLVRSCFHNHTNHTCLILSGSSRRNWRRLIFPAINNIRRVRDQYYTLNLIADSHYAERCCVRIFFDLFPDDCFCCIPRLVYLIYRPICIYIYYVCCTWNKDKNECSHKYTRSHSGHILRTSRPKQGSDTPNSLVRLLPWNICKLVSGGVVNTGVSLTEYVEDLLLRFGCNYRTCGVLSVFHRELVTKAA
jgi:hypothetical protein